ncbi:MAG: PKD domain-containing protein [Bacteroidetes bacterium]|nr:PKD domain-containing protein [Bacteroidota bacterium]
MALRKTFILLLLSSILIGISRQAKAQCVADYSIISRSCDKDTVHFSFTGNGKKFQWDFDDPASGVRNSDTLSNPKHQFTSAGSYYVRLVVFDSACTDTVTKLVQIYTNPTIAYSYSNNCKNLISKYNSSITIDSVDSIRQIYWFLNNVLIDSGSNISHIFSDTGIINLSTVVVTGEGCTDSFNKPIKVFPAPVIESDKSSACEDKDINFNLKSGFVPEIKNYKWNFGDGSISSQASPKYQFSNGGLYPVSLLLTYSDSSSCLSNADSIKITNKPNTAFRLLSDSVQCFQGNQFCFEFLGREKNLSYRSVIFGDGNKNNTFPLTDSTLYYSYNDSLGRVYSITYEAIDSNGCSNTTTIDSLITLHPKINLLFGYSRTLGCFSTPVSFTNYSNTTPPSIIKFKWDFGDSTLDSTSWNPSHTYTQNGIFSVSLEVLSDKGCQVKTTYNKIIENVNFKADTHLDSVISFCRSDNKFFYKQTPILGASVRWYWGDGDTSYTWSVNKHYNNPGTYYPRIRIWASNCIVDTVFDTITITGPRALASNIINRYQCQIKDTIYFTNSSLFDFNKSRSTFWDFGDIYAPSCTTNLAKGINVGMNCRYSTDSILTQHYYTPGKEQCYYTKLVVSDSIIGCADSTYISLPLTAPKADIDLLATPPRLGMSLNKNRTCLSEEGDYVNVLVLNLNNTQPACARQRWWVMWDSLGARQSGSFDSHWESYADSHYYSFANKPADTNGYVTIGLIIENGSDSSNNVCRDTAWYHHFLKFEIYDPEFVSDYDSTVQYCKGSTFTFRLKDTTQKALSKVIWDWADGSLSQLTSGNLTAPIKHTFYKPGIYKVIVTVITDSGCIATYSKRIEVGYNINFGVSNVYSSSGQRFCENTKIPLSFDVGYIGTTRNEWHDTMRLKAGKEKIRWDMGDGLGYQDLGFPPFSYQYNKGGYYKISLIAEDSVGCMDTMTVPDAILITHIKSKITTSQDSFVCAQGIQFNSNVSQYDSTSTVPQGSAETITYRWEFAPGIPYNTLSDPFVLLKEGDYNVKLKVTNTTGCEDSSFKSISIIGPKAEFVFLSDSIGCQPLEVTFKNKSKGATNYIWRFKDSSGNVLNTVSSGNVSFTYPQFGKYYPSLTVQGTYIKNGVSITCSNTFPDSIPKPFREITVLEIPKPDFTHVTNCFSKTTQFTNKTYTGSSTLNSVYWDFGDGSTSTDNNPSHQYSDTGRYTITLIAYSANGCSDTLKRMIVISPTPIPNFNFTNQCAGVPIQFKDSTKTFNDVIVNWSWSFGDSTFSNLNIENKSYAKGGSYNVKLVVTNMAGCSDSVSKIVKVHYKPLVNFSVPHTCSHQDLAISNLSSVADTTLSYQWNFADGTYSTDFAPSKSYTNNGNYKIKLQALSGFGCVDSITKNIQINPTPYSNFNINSATQCFAEHEFVFSNTTSLVSGTFSSLWKFGDGNTSVIKSPTHQYTSIGSYAIDLITTSDFGCKDTISKSVTVQSNPSANFTIDKVQQCLLGNAFTFTDITGTPNRTWQIKGINYADSVLKYSFVDTGVHTIRMVAISTNTCTDTIYRTVEVLPMPIAKIGVNSPGQCVNNQNFSFSDLTTLAKYPSWTPSWDFGNGKTAGISNPTTSYDTAGFYTVTLKVLSSKGCADTTQYKVEVYSKPTPDFAINDDEQCQLNNLFVFTNKSKVAKGSLSYQWTFGDGASSILTNPKHSYTLKGNLPVKLITTSSLGCVDSISRTITLRAKPTASIAVNKAQQCINPNLFTFSSKSQSNEGSFVSYEWNIPSQPISSLQTNDTFFYSFPNYGAFPVHLYVTTSFGCADSTQMSVEVYPKPKSLFSINDSTQCLNKQLFSFSNLSTIPYGTLSYQWTFGDGKGSTAKHPSYTFNNADTFIVKMIATSNNNCKDTTSLPVIVYPKPFVNFNINDSGQCLTGNLYELNNLSNISYGTLSYFWDLGNGKTSTQKDTQISYNAYGTYKILLQSTSNFGCIDSVSYKVKVYPKPTPDFAINKEKQCLNENQYKISSRSNIAYGTLTYQWQLGDGATASGDSIIHHYNNIGTYTIKMVSTSNFGCVDSSSKEIRIWANPQSAFAANNPAQCINTQDFQFINQSRINEGAIDSQTWNFGNGNFSNSQSPNQFFKSTGRYRISLISHSDSGCLDSAVNYIDIYPKPEAAFDINDTSQCLYTNLFEFTDQSKDTLNLINYRWILGNDSSANSKNTSFKFNKIGFHDIEHQVISELGCADTIIRKIYVKPMPDPSFEKLDIYYCNNKGPFSFNTTTPGGTFYGKNIENNLYMPQILWRDTIEYKVTVDGCLDSSSQVTQVYPAPSVFLGSDTMLCKYESLEFDVSFWNSTYEWQDRNKEAKYLVKRPGLYKVTVTNFCGSVSDSVYVEYGEYNCRLYLPTSFSPNKDGLNDYYNPITYDVESFHIQIFNRWGQMVYDGTQNDPGWDGSYMGMPCEPGMFIVQVSYSYKFKNEYRNITESSPLYLMK